MKQPFNGKKSPFGQPVGTKAPKKVVESSIRLRPFRQNIQADVDAAAKKSGSMK